ncbi:hypothetical protein BJ322DRAFT_1213636 [Thelephora terrestris]|uniref:Novel STAND NTPase 1 domain-containing protein n=1 Tax=Thelephora terrestris TaxID=56493 RepID=A0A9P6H9G7_9AGAM|nr:hypothetical protein BJ322DRAFT_1213636 [Thelephora terrestris]
MATNCSHPSLTEGHDRALTASIETLNLAEQNSGIRPAQTVFGSAGVLLATIRDSAANDQEYVKLGLSCANVCRALDRGLNGRRTEDLSGCLLGAIDTLTTTVAAIQNAIIQQGKQGPASPPFHTKHDKEKIAAWGRDLDRILLIFNTELSINNHVMLLDIRRDVQTGQGSADGRTQSIQGSIPLGELPPPAPKAFFGRGALIEEVVSHVAKLESIAIIGAGGIGKTSIAFTVLHDDRIKARFGDNRRFIRCEQFLASRVHFLSRLSKVIGAGVENPEDLVPLRPFLSSKETLIVLDNAESILDPQGPNHREIYAVVDELCQFKTVCLCITSRITTVPRYCKRPQIPTLSTEAAREIFYGIYGNGERSNTIDNLLQRLDFHALSITLLATTASDNVWDHDRLAKEWDEQRAQVLRTDQNESLAATIELSLTSPMFRKLGPDAHDLLGVVAFFPQGFCALSLTHRSGGFITMLAPIRDYFRPRDPNASPLLCATRDHYFTRLSVNPDPDRSRFGETQWIVPEDVNIEHLLDIFTSIDAGAVNVWDACGNFLHHLYWHKPQQTTLGTKIEGLPDGHPSKAKCLLELAQLSGAIGNDAERKRLLIHTLTLERERGNDFGVAETLQSLSYANRYLGVYKEGIEQAKEAFEMFERLGDTREQVVCLDSLASLFLQDSQLDAAEDTALGKISLLPEKGQEFNLCQSHRLLGKIYRRKGDKDKAVHHFNSALTIAFPSNWQGELFWIHYEMAEMFRDEGEFDDANAHIERAKSLTADNAYNMGCGMEMQAHIWYRQHRLEDARFEALGALEIYERLGAAKDVGGCQRLFQMIEQAMESLSVSSGLGSDAYWTAPSTPVEGLQEFDWGPARQCPTPERNIAPSLFFSRKFSVVLAGRLCSFIAVCVIALLFAVDVCHVPSDHTFRRSAC